MRVVRGGQCPRIDARTRCTYIRVRSRATSLSRDGLPHRSSVTGRHPPPGFAPQSEWSAAYPLVRALPLRQRTLRAAHCCLRSHYILLRTACELLRAATVNVRTVSHTQIRVEGDMGTRAAIGAGLLLLTAGAAAAPLVVPEQSSYALMVVGFIALLLLRRRVS